ncbi:nucleotide pyrophosphohydrolase [Listeria ilorinensis]|uniref:nucleotide pyrophosphohydrolase n=1 Tax=Listeria ilorinensis TaxID=2867439 RepID=UPI001EF6FAF3|nr:nucleotide pyrophosphohydrolase [Listeria ilorinensis]
MKKLQNEITDFLKEKDWLDQYQHQKELAAALSVEAAELLECFQWKSSAEALAENREEILEEVADVMIYALQIVESMGEDGTEVIRRKLAINRAR